MCPSPCRSDIDYDQILVPITGARVSDEMMVLACQLATEKKSSIDGLYVIEVPLNPPLDARLVTEREQAEKVLGLGGGHRRPVQGEVHAARGDRASPPATPSSSRRRERRSEVIILGTVRKRRIADRVFGRTRRLRARPRAVRGTAEPGAQGLSDRGLGRVAQDGTSAQRATTSQPAPPPPEAADEAWRAEVIAKTGEVNMYVVIAGCGRRARAWRATW